MAPLHFNVTAGFFGMFRGVAPRLVPMGIALLVVVVLIPFFYVLLVVLDRHVRRKKWAKLMASDVSRSKSASS